MGTQMTVHRGVRATNSGEFGGRFRHASAATPDNRIWVFGGQDSNNNNFNDVWASTNGSGWKLANSTSAWSRKEPAFRNIPQ